MNTRYAIPLLNGKLSSHFGQCEEIAFIDVDAHSRVITGITRKPVPPHEPGVLPRFLVDNKTNVAIVGGMGMRARQLLEEGGIRVIMGVESLDPEVLVKRDLAGQLSEGDNTCSHGPDHVCDGSGHGHKHSSDR